MIWWHGEMVLSCESICGDCMWLLTFDNNWDIYIFGFAYITFHLKLKYLKLIKDWKLHKLVPCWCFLYVVLSFKTKFTMYAWMVHQALYLPACKQMAQGKCGLPSDLVLSGTKNNKWGIRPKDDLDLHRFEDDVLWEMFFFDSEIVCDSFFYWIIHTYISKQLKTMIHCTLRYLLNIKILQPVVLFFP